MELVKKSHTPVLFLPGMMCDERVFSPQVECLGPPTAVVDFSKLSGVNTIMKMAHRAFDISLKKGWKKFIVCGLSMGGIVAMEMMAQNPKVLKGAILIDTNHLADSEEKQHKRNQQNFAIQSNDRSDKKVNSSQQQEFVRIIKEDMKPFYLSDSQSEKAKQLWDLFFSMAINIGLDEFIRQNLALRDRPDYQAVIRQFPHPCLIICGEHDPLCPPKRHQEITDLIPNSELHVIPEAAHIANLEKAEEVNSIIIKWMERHLFL